MMVMMVIMMMEEQVDDDDESKERLTQGFQILCCSLLILEVHRTFDAFNLLHSFNITVYINDKVTSYHLLWRHDDAFILHQLHVHVLEQTLGTPTPSPQNSTKVPWARKGPRHNTKLKAPSSKAGYKSPGRIINQIIYIEYI